MQTMPPPLPRRPAEPLVSAQPPPRIPARPAPPASQQQLPPSYPTAYATPQPGAPPPYAQHPRPQMAAGPAPPRPAPPPMAHAAAAPVLPPRPGGAPQSQSRPPAPTGHGHYNPYPSPNPAPALPSRPSGHGMQAVAAPPTAAPYITSLAPSKAAQDEDSIAGVLKETSMDYLRGIGHGVNALLAREEEDDPIRAEQQRQIEREREKEHQRKEEAYIAQQKLRVLNEEEQRRRAATQNGPAASSSMPQRQQSSSLPAGSHQINFELTGSLKKEHFGKAFTVYAIDVSWNGMNWTVYRRYKQFSEFNAQAKKASVTFAYAMPGKKLQGNLKDQFVEQRQRELQKYVQAVSAKAPSMMSAQKARVALLRFFAPTQVGDKGVASGSLPFDLAELV